VIDDDPELLTMIGMILRRAGYQVVLSSDPVEGLGRLVEERPDLLILDLMMPHMNGFELCEAVRKSADIADLPIIILTARIQEKDRETALALGVRDYLTKPITARQLLVNVRTILAGSASAP
jgi:DNA-binding response OmpR family regulator